MLKTETSQLPSEFAIDTDTQERTLGLQDKTQKNPASHCLNEHSTQISGLAIGTIISFADNTPIVLIENGSERILRSAVSVACQLDALHDVGVSVCIAFDGQDISRPIVLGKIVLGLPTTSTKVHQELTIDSPGGIVLKSGKSTLLLKPDGTVSIRGTNVASRASHTNRIRGGNVQIN